MQKQKRGRSVHLLFYGVILLFKSVQGGGSAWKSPDFIVVTLWMTLYDEILNTKLHFCAMLFRRSSTYCFISLQNYFGMVLQFCCTGISSFNLIFIRGTYWSSRENTSASSLKTSLTFSIWLCGRPEKSMLLITFNHGDMLARRYNTFSICSFYLFQLIFLFTY